MAFPLPRVRLPFGLPALPVVSGRRHVREHDGRVHVELRGLDAERLAIATPALVGALRGCDGVEWVQVIPRMSRVVVGTAGAFDVEAIVDAVQAVESEHARGGGRPPGHPDDDDVLARQLIELGGDLAGLGLGLLRRMVRVAPTAATTDFAALIGVAQYVPRIRDRFESQIGGPMAEIGLEVAGAMASGLAQGPLGPFVDVLHRSTTLAEAVARRRVWRAQEGALLAGGQGDGEATPVPTSPETRPVPLPSGPVERYAERAWPVSLGAFAVALPLTRSLERATAALSAGLPKAARLGREAFAVQLGRGLADRGVVVLDDRPLRLLDRIDTAVVEAELIRGDAATDLLAAIERAGLALCVVGDADAEDLRLGEHAQVPAAHGLADEIRSRQARGEVVLAIGGPEFAAGLAVADLAVGIHAEGARAPWSAHMICGGGADDALVVVDACLAAREVSIQSATIALGGASVGGLMAFGGILPGAPIRVTTAVNLASLVAIVNGTRAGLGVLQHPERPPRDPTPWHALGHEQVLDRLGSSHRGLDESAASARWLAPSRPDPTVVRIAKSVGEELVNPLTPILAVGAGLSVAVGSVVDAAMVSGVVGMNALIGGVQRFQADRAIEALGATATQRVLVRRGGVERRIDATELVQGDVIRLEAGEAVPADCRILEAHAVEADESALTGESLPVVKSATPSSAEAVAERTSMLYEGTSIAAGKCWAVVVAVGPATEARRAVALGRTRTPQSGVEARLRSLTDLTVPIALGSGLGIIGLGLLRGNRLLDVASSGVSLAVAAVPEGLPLLATVAQLSAARRLSASGALVRNPRAIEALGRVDVLCADKTGTLTEGRIRVGRVSDGVDDYPLDDLPPRAREVLAAASRATPHSTSGRRLPHPTDRAVLYAEEGAGVPPYGGLAGWAQRGELPFEPGRGFHAVLADTASAKRRLSVKGAPEVLLPACSTWLPQRGPARRLGAADRARLVAEAGRLAGVGYRVLVVAERDVPVSFTLADADICGLRFVGFLCLTDPVRPTAAAAVAQLRRAGIEVVMITGDHPSTAHGVGTELGIANGRRVLTGIELDELDDAALEAALDQIGVFARVTPAHKVRIVRAYQRAGRIVGMTGDGANDAPAIRLADVGIALGSRSTAAARDAADLVVTDDRIESIVDAIVEGRGMWGSVRDAVAMLVGSNLGEIGFTVAGSLISGTPPLNARQLLAVNLLTDVAPAMAIAVRPPRGASPDQLLREGPDASLGERLNESIATRAVITGSTATAAWLAARFTGTPARARTVGMAALVGTQLGQTLAIGGRDPVVMAAGVGSAAVLAAIIQTPGLSQLFGCRPLGPAGWSIATTAAAAGTALTVLAPRVLALPGLPASSRGTP